MMITSNQKRSTIAQDAKYIVDKLAPEELTVPTIAAKLRAYRDRMIGWKHKEGSNEVLMVYRDMSYMKLTFMPPGNIIVECGIVESVTYEGEPVWDLKQQSEQTKH